MRWQELLPIILHHSSHPLLVLDETRCIRLMSPRMEQLTGLCNADVVGRRWTDVCIPTGARLAARRALDDALATNATRIQAPLGRGPTAATLKVVRVGRSVVLVAAGEEVSSVAVDRTYEIVLDGGPRDGTLRSLRFLDERVDESHHVGERCYAALAGRPAPCPGCPAFGPGGRQGPRSVVLDGPAPDHVHIADSMPVDGAARVTVRFFDLGHLPSLVRLKMDRLAQCAGLSSREQEVLALLLLGRNSGEIGQLLSISARTAKFHMANLLEKLGVDSRLDLVALLL